MASLEAVRSPLNFRDVGAVVNALLGQRVLVEGALLRSGSPHGLSLYEIGCPRTILNLAVELLDTPEEVSVVSLPLSIYPYETDYPLVREWLLNALDVVAHARLPILIHCWQGRDRTGVVVAAVLSCLSVPPRVIEEEFLLSDSGCHWSESRQAIRLALTGIDPGAYGDGVVGPLRERFLHAFQLRQECG